MVLVARELVPSEFVGGGIIWRWSGVVVGVTSCGTSDDWDLVFFSKIVATASNTSAGSNCKCNGTNGKICGGAGTVLGSL